MNEDSEIAKLCSVGRANIYCRQAGVNAERGYVIFTATAGLIRVANLEGKIDPLLIAIKAQRCFNVMEINVMCCVSGSFTNTRHAFRLYRGERNPAPAPQCAFYRGKSLRTPIESAALCETKEPLPRRP